MMSVMSSYSYNHLWISAITTAAITAWIMLLNHEEYLTKNSLAGSMNVYAAKAGEANRPFF